jgi:hypothetical protein
MTAFGEKRTLRTPDLLHEHHTVQPSRENFSYTFG